jgi:hypothetical protein
MRGLLRALGLVVLAFLLGFHGLASQVRAPVVTLDEVGVRASFGLSTSESNAELAKPIDAGFSGSSVVILDAAAPWVRVFDRQGRLLRALSTIGDGPGEARRPFSVAGTTDGGVLLSHATGIERWDAAGAYVRSIRNVRASGAIEACGGLLALVEPAAARPWWTMLVRMNQQGAVSDTLVRIEPARPNNRSYQPWYAQATTNGILFYPEDERRSRVLELSCDGTVRREVPIPQLGRGDSVVVVGGRTGVAVAKPPHPAGLVRVQDRLLWAARAVNTLANNRADSVTNVTAIDQAGRVRQVSIRGWYQLFDSASDGGLLFGNSWSIGMNWQRGATTGLIPAVFLVDGAALIRIIDERGVTPR